MDLRYSGILPSHKIPNEDISRLPKIQDIFISLNLEGFCGDAKLFEQTLKMKCNYNFVLK